jgi:hypothetical protein
MSLSKQSSTTRSFIAGHILSAHKSDTNIASRDGCMICQAWFWLIEEYDINLSSATELLLNELKNPLKGIQDG